ncbi:SMI1/KNR4 family protein [Paenibacillus hunanensis]|uniref:SMI1/KNR4 family protein n=1 Tax=Paenibacillus hunanensis TaxID=539262 RepID=UPI002A6ABA11|nr:SMI1/KNR4 family protein [Paenibacillus hunanensis]WPP43263.1 SMI1/KNR4 family protein [Paenibacillus hunanensis]
MYRSLQARLEQYPYSHTQNAASSEWIAEAEQELGYRLPDSYVWWLTHYGSLFFNRQDGVYSLAPPEFREDVIDDLLYNYRLMQRQIGYQGADYTSTAQMRRKAIIGM